MCHRSCRPRRDREGGPAGERSTCGTTPDPAAGEAEGETPADWRRQVGKQTEHNS